MGTTSRGAALAALIAGLGCSGLLPADPAAVQAREDASDPAEIARQRGDWTGAEGILQDRLRDHPDDARSWRLLGDVNLSRGQQIAERWKENLGWAVDDYARAVALAPTDCAGWARLAAAAVSGAENPATQVAKEKLDALPLDQGRASCPGAALLAIDLLRRPPDVPLADPTALLAAAPWIAETAHRVPLGSIAWAPGDPAAPLAAGAPFVVLQPATAGPVDGSEPRRFTEPEWLVVQSVASGRITFVDRRFPARVPKVAVTRAPGCPGTRWELEGPDRIAVGECAAGPQDRRASDLYDPAILRPAGPAHYHEPSISLARIPWDAVADKEIRCLGGPVGRMFVETPSCAVAYDQAVPQTRTVPASSGIPAWTTDQAAGLAFLARAGPLVGDDAAAHLGRGEIGPGLPYSWFALGRPELTGCKGRGIFQKLAVVDGALEFTCELRGATWRFRDLTLAEVRSAGP